MIDRTKIYIQEIIDKHRKESGTPIESISLAIPVYKFFNLDWKDNHVTIRGITYELNRKTSFHNKIFINGNLEYEINVPCTEHTFVLYTGFKEVYRYCINCNEKIF